MISIQTLVETSQKPIAPQRLETFAQVYRAQLDKAARDFPEVYRMSPEQIPTVADKMLAAVVKGVFNKDGRAFKATCKALRIKHTYIAIDAYLAGN